MTFDDLSAEQQAAVRAKVRETVQPLAAKFVAEHGALEDDEFIARLQSSLQRMADKAPEKDPLDKVFGQEMARACISRRNRIAGCEVAGTA